MDTIDQIFTYLGVGITATAIAFGLIKYFSKNLFENYLQKKLESHKNELERLNITYQIQFTSLHSERGTIIKKLYEVLQDYKIAVIDFFDGNLDSLHPDKHLNSQLTAWTSIVLEFSNLFHKNKIFFSLSQVELINRIHNEMSKINSSTQDFLIKYKYVNEQVEAIQNKSEEFNLLKLKSDKLIDEIMLLERDLENEFRRLLGVK